MKRLQGWMTLGFSLGSLFFLALAYFGSVATVSLMATAVCWAAGFAWFVKFGRLAEGRMRWVFSAAFWTLCVVVLGGVVWCVWYMIKG